MFKNLRIDKSGTGTRLICDRGVIATMEAGSQTIRDSDAAYIVQQCTASPMNPLHVKIAHAFREARDMRACSESFLTTAETIWQYLQDSIAKTLDESSASKFDREEFDSECEA